MHNDSPEATRVMLDPDPKAHCRHYYRNLPPFAIGVDEPWWWAVLALGADVINVHFETAYRGPLAVIGRPQKGLHYNLDCEAVGAILKAQNRPSFDAYRCPKGGAGRVVGIVDVIDCHNDATAEGHWFSGPFGLEVEKPCMLPLQHTAPMFAGDGSALLPVSAEKQSSIRYALTSLANMRI